MRRFFQTLGLSSLLLVSMTLTGCLQTRGQLKESEGKQELQKQVVTLQSSRAEFSNDLEEIKDQIRKLNGKIEVVEGQVFQAQSQWSQSQASKGKDQEDVQLKLKALEQATDAQERMILALTEEVKKLQVHLSTPSSRSSNQGKDNDKNEFQLAEDSFAKKDWKAAIVGYQKYRETNPKGKKYGEATYKIGVSFQELGMGEEAKTFFDEVVDKFPKSDNAKKAKFRLQQLKK